MFAHLRHLLHNIPAEPPASVIWYRTKTAAITMAECVTLPHPLTGYFGGVAGHRERAAWNAWCSAVSKAYSLKRLARLATRAQALIDAATKPLLDTKTFRLTDLHGCAVARRENGSCRLEVALLGDDAEAIPVDALGVALHLPHGMGFWLHQELDLVGGASDPEPWDPDHCWPWEAHRVPGTLHICDLTYEAIGILLGLDAVQVAKL